MKVKIHSGNAFGRVVAPPSKSMAHRLLIAAALAEGESRVDGLSLCEDVLATIDCLRLMGADISLSGRCATVRGFDPRKCKPNKILFAKESGSTLRFLLPISFISGESFSFSGAGRLMERPMTVYEELCSEAGIAFCREGGRITVCGRLPACDFELAGNVSSQFITGLLFILPFLGGDRRIKIKGKLESRSYIDLTIQAMGEFGAFAEWESADTLLVRGGSGYKARSVQVEGDYSAAAFPEALRLLGDEVEVCGLKEDSLQGDRAYRAHFAALSEGFSEISLEDCPDLGPILFTVAAACHGGRFTSTARLRIKESDRATAMAEELAKFGAKIEVCEDTVTVYPATLHAPSEILCGHNDHRVVMSLAILCTRFGGIIDEAEAIAKSYPEFFEDLGRLNIRIEEYKD